MIKKHVMVNASRRALLLLAIVLSFLSLVVAQKSAEPLKLRLIVPDPEVCLGTGNLSLEVVFSNTTDSPLSIYSSGIYGYSFIKTVIRSKGSKVESHEDRKDVGTGDPSRHETPILLQPHASIVLPLAYNVSNAYFRESGTYSMHIRYMKLNTAATPPEAVVPDTASNEVLFEMTECH